MFDGVAQEVPALSGFHISYYSLNRAASIQDPLYQEPTTESDFVFLGPYDIIGNLEVPTWTWEENEVGGIGEIDALAHLSRKSIEDNHWPLPKRGDILLVWNTPQPLFTKYDIVKVTPTEFYWGTGDHMFWTCELKRHADAPGEQKIP